jgi:hypothetical protein
VVNIDEYAQGRTGRRYLLFDMYSLDAVLDSLLVAPIRHLRGEPFFNPTDAAAGHPIRRRKELSIWPWIG